MKKKILNLLLIGILALGLTGCGKSNELSNDKSNNKENQKEVKENGNKESINNDTKLLICEESMNDAYNFKPYDISYKLIFEWDLTGQISKLSEEIILKTINKTIDDESKKAFMKEFGRMKLVSNSDNKITMQGTLSLNFLSELGIDTSSEPQDVKNHLESETDYICY